MKNKTYKFLVRDKAIIEYYIKFSGKSYAATDVISFFRKEDYESRAISMRSPLAESHLQKILAELHGVIYYYHYKVITISVTEQYITELRLKNSYPKPIIVKNLLSSMVAGKVLSLLQYNQNILTVNEKIKLLQLSAEIININYNNFEFSKLSNVYTHLYNRSLAFLNYKFTGIVMALRELLPWYHNRYNGLAITILGSQEYFESICYDLDHYSGYKEMLIKSVTLTKNRPGINKYILPQAQYNNPDISLIEQPNDKNCNNMWSNVSVNPTYHAQRLNQGMCLPMAGSVQSVCSRYTQRQARAIYTNDKPHFRNVSRPYYNSVRSLVTSVYNYTNHPNHTNDVKLPPSIISHASTHWSDERPYSIVANRGS